MVTLGIGQGMAMNLPHTKNKAAPMPIATIDLTALFFMI
jgi:hypothetical protein